MHCEDLDLGAINYHHFGMPKVWYFVAGIHATRMEEVINKMINDSSDSESQNASKCNNLMRHKDYILTPQFLTSHNIEYTVIQQNEGEFIVTFPRTYHQGFNLGLNLCEATNFGNQNWIQYGRDAKQCDCTRKIKPPFDINI